MVEKTIAAMSTIIRNSKGEEVGRARGTSGNVVISGGRTIEYRDTLENERSVRGGAHVTGYPNDRPVFVRGNEQKTIPRSERHTVEHEVD